jgi:hypothetical protein
LHPRWWLMWFMPIPVLLVAARSSGPRAFFVALVAWFLGSLNMWGCSEMYCRCRWFRCWRS